MICKFNDAQLSRPQRESLRKVCDVLQLENENEIVVTPVEFPYKLKVKLDDDVMMILGWDFDNESYAGLTEPEPEKPNEPKPGAIKPFEIPEKKDTVDSHGTETVDLPGPESLMETKLEPEIDLTPVFERADALAVAFFNLCKPLDSERRLKLRTHFVTRLIKDRELLK